MEDPLSTSRRTAALLRPHARSLALAAALAGVVSLCQGAVVWLVKGILDALSGPQATTRAPWLAGAVVLLFVVQGGARVGRTWITRRAALAVESELRSTLFAHTLRRDPAAVAAEGAGELLSRLSHDAGRIRPAVGAAVTAVQRPLSALALGLSAAAMAPRLALYAVVAVPAVAAIITWTGARTRRASREHLEALARLEARARDLIEGLRVLQAHGAEARAAEGYREASEVQAQRALNASVAAALGPPVVELVAAGAVAAVVVLGAREVSAGAMQASNLMAFLVGLGLLHDPLKGIAQVHALWQESQPGLERVYAALDRPPAVEESPSAQELHTRQLAVELRGVVVDRGRGPVLDGLDLRLEPGELVAIVGASGAGKSTLVDVIARFVEPTAGVVLVAGQPADTWTLASLRRHLALVDPRPWLGAGTLAEAIHLGRPDAADAEVRRAAHEAGLGYLIRRLPEGLQTPVGDGGAALSSGERQRVSLARALIRGAPLLLLDEPTANLDPASEESLLDTLSGLRGGRTLLLITHREAPLRRADRVLVLRDGRLEPAEP